MNNVMEYVKSRRSIRTFDGETVDDDKKKKLLAFLETIQNPFNIPVKFRLLDAEKNGLACPVVTGTSLFMGAKIKNTTNTSVAFGYSFEKFVLYAQSIGLGTVWIGGTMNRSAFEKAMELENDEIMPCMSPIGYPAKKMSLRESMMRKAVKGDERMPFEKLFFNGSCDTPLTKEKAGKFAEPLEAVRLAPSAVNKQPWRVIADGNNVHFYLKRSNGFNYNDKLDMQMIDMGIALCHFDLVAKEKGITLGFSQSKPNIVTDSENEYVASFIIDK